ncbi:hypothetical protein CspeluHIS016_0300050 [Cutaneotrichosporon spelunceum]|uniref:Uncharacterized protein n=1 Tax=Cutaneotrichosporon spelunceum TaxID=1672016 RepID=A0AAD3YAM5_9TREE|nr:hypothetical protein CspeluHIS016_0300050 [Cutaneotrichosporon spelunceum]
MQQKQLVRTLRLDARTLRRLLKLVRVQLAHLPRPTVPLALSVPRLSSLPLLQLETLSVVQSVVQSAVQPAVQTSLQTLPGPRDALTSLRSLSSLQHISVPFLPSIPSLSSLPSLSSFPALPPLPRLNLNLEELHILLSRLLLVAHTRLPRALARSLPSDPAHLGVVLNRLAVTQVRAYAVRYCVQLALSVLRLLPQAGLPVPLRVVLSLARFALRHVVGQAVRVAVALCASPPYTSDQAKPQADRIAHGLVPRPKWRSEKAARSDHAQIQVQDQVRLGNGRANHSPPGAAASQPRRTSRPRPADRPRHCPNAAQHISRAQCPLLLLAIKTVEQTGTMRLLFVLSLVAASVLAHEGHDHGNSTSNATDSAAAMSGSAAASAVSSGAASASSAVAGATQTSGAERLAAGGAALLVAAVGMAL